jgi:hypothetical protein
MAGWPPTAMFFLVALIFQRGFTHNRTSAATLGNEQNNRSNYARQRRPIQQKVFHLPSRETTPRQRNREDCGKDVPKNIATVTASQNAIQFIAFQFVLIFQGSEMNLENSDFQSLLKIPYCCLCVLSFLPSNNLQMTPSPAYSRTI